MTPVSHGKPCAGNPHARFDEGASASETPRRNALLHKSKVKTEDALTAGTNDILTDNSTVDHCKCDIEMEGWRVDVDGIGYAFPIGKTVRVGEAGSDIVLTGNGTAGCCLVISLETNMVTIENRGSKSVSVDNKKVSSGQRSLLSCLFAPFVVTVCGTVMRISAISSLKVAAEGLECGRVIGRGGQGVVFEAICTSPVFEGLRVLDKVALKVLYGYGSDDDLRKINALVAKCGNVGAMRYYGCLRVYNGAVPMTAIVMELLDGESLYMRMRRCPHGLDVDVAVLIMEDIVRCLSYLHEKGIVHRDIKPGNVFICRDGFVSILDLTSAKWDDDAIGSSNGKGIGTLSYRAPEMAAPDFAGDVQSDIYSAVLVFQEMLCGMHYDDEERGLLYNDWDNDRGFYPCHPRLTMKDRLVNAGKLAIEVNRIIEKGLSSRAGRYSSCDALLSDMEGIRLPIYEHGNHRYMRLTYERCEGCVKNGIAYGKILDMDTGETLKWKTFGLSTKDTECGYSEGEVCAGLLSNIHDSSLTWGVETAFRIDDGKEHQLLLVYRLGMCNPENTPRYNGNVLGGVILGGKYHNEVSYFSRRIPVPDALVAFSQYARGLSILHEAGIKAFDVAPDVLVYEEGRPSSSSLTCRRHGCWCDNGAGPPASDINISRGNGWEDCFRSLYRLPDGTQCDAFALGLCLYEAITGQRGYAKPFRDERMRILHKGRVYLDFDHPVLVKCADIADLIRQITEIDERRRLKDMDKIEKLLRELAVKYRLRNPESTMSDGQFQVEVGEGSTPPSELAFSLNYQEGGIHRDFSFSPHKAKTCSELEALSKIFKMKTVCPKPIKLELMKLRRHWSGLNLDVELDLWKNECDIRECPEPVS